jgi:Ca2+-binding EF-hand superfamily protein
MMFDLHELYRQEFALFSRYREGKITKEEYLAYMKPLDKAISELEMATLEFDHISKKASSQHFQKPEH